MCDVVDVGCVVYGECVVWYVVCCFDIGGYVLWWVVDYLWLDDDWFVCCFFGVLYVGVFVGVGVVGFVVWVCFDVGVVCVYF